MKVREGSGCCEESHNLAWGQVRRLLTPGSLSRIWESVQTDRLSLLTGKSLGNVFVCYVHRPFHSCLPSVLCAKHWLDACIYR